MAESPPAVPETPAANPAPEGQPKPAPKVIGKVLTVQGEAWIIHDGHRIPAKPEAALTQGDSVETAQGAQINMVFADRSTFALKDKGMVGLDEFTYDPATKQGSETFLVAQGAFNFVSGDIAKTQPDAARLATPVMTMGIRGTTVAGAVGANGATSVALLPDPGSNFVGEVSVSRTGGGGESFTISAAGSGIVGATSGGSWSVASNAGAAVAASVPAPIPPPATPPALPAAPAAPTGPTGAAPGAAAVAAAAVAAPAAQAAAPAPVAAQGPAPVAAQQQAAQQGVAVEVGQQVGPVEGAQQPPPPIPVDARPIGPVDAGTGAGKTDTGPGPGGGPITGGGLGQGDGNTKGGNVTVSQNHDPVTSTVSLSRMNSGGSVTINKSSLLSNATDQDGHPLSAKAITADHGTIVDNGDGTLTFTPNPGYGGPVTVSYVVDDGKGGTAAGTLTFDLNIAPVAGADPGLGAVTYNTPTSIALSTLTTGASDGDSDSLTVASASVTHGTVTISGGNLIYTPDSGYSGADTLTYVISDGHGGTVTATAALTINAAVNNAPVAGADPGLAGVTEDTPQSFAISTLVSTATDADSDPLTVSSASALHGTVTISGGNVIYTPDANYTGADTLTYVIDDSLGGTVSTTAALTITGANDAPMVADATNHGVTLSGSGQYLTSAGSASLGSNFTYEAWVKDAGTSMWGGIISTTGDPTAWAQLTMFSGGYFGVESYNGSAPMTSSVTAINDGKWHHVAAAFDGSTVTLYLDGKMEATGTANTLPNPVGFLIGGDHDGIVTFNGNISDVKIWTQTRTEAQILNDAFSDPTGGEMASLAAWYPLTEASGTTATNSVATTWGNAAATGAPDWNAAALSVVENGSTSITGSLLTGAGVDADGDTLTLIGGTALHGTVTLSAGNLLYTPDASYVGSDTITYTLSDGNGGNGTGTVTMTVTSLGAAPTLSNGNAPANFIEGSSAVAVLSGVSLADADSANLTSATLTITNHQSGDTLNFTTQNGITGSYDSSAGVLIMSGSATIANYQTAVQSVTFENPGAAVSLYDRSLSLVVSDGSLSSSSLSHTVAVTIANDTLTATGGVDSLDGGDGSNTYAVTQATFDASDVIADSGTHAGDIDVIAIGSAGTMDFSASAVSGIETLSFVGGGGNNVILAAGQIGQFTSFAGGAGNDTLTLQGSGSTVVLSGATLTSIETVAVTGSGTTAGIDLASTTNDVVADASGFSGSVVAYAGSGADTFIAGSGVSHTFINGNDWVHAAGNAGDELISMTAAHLIAAPTLAPTGAANMMVLTTAGTITDAAFANVSNIDSIGIEGGTDLTLGSNANTTGINKVDAGYAATGVVINASAHSGGMILYGGSGDDTITGGGSADSIVAGSGNDVIYAAGNDALIDGGAGSDTFVISGTNFEDPIFNDGFLTGVETISIANATSAGQWFKIDDQTDGFTINVTSTQNVTIQGSQGNDVINGGSAGEYLWGFSGNDTIAGGLGANTIYGDSGVDTVTYASGTTAITATITSGGMSISHDSGQIDTVTSMEALVGTSYDDTFTASGSASETIYGGSGADAFQLSATGTITVGDYGTGSDYIDLSNAQFGLGSVGNLSATQYAESATAMSASAVDYGGGNTGAGIVAIQNGGSVELWQTTAMEAASTANSHQIGTLTGVNTSALDNTQFHLAV